jgi:putative two-component system response regulator
MLRFLDAIAQAKESKPDIVILDTNLGGMDGFEACQKIKELDGSTAKIIVMTGLIDAVDAGRAREMGADDYCVKTADYADIIESVKNLLI